jgi:shikimate kinase
MSNEKRIVLTGFMGVGKSTVAKCLAQILKTPYADLDRAIEARAGLPIATIIDQEGETKLRELETLCLEELLQNAKLNILSLGGGAWTLARNRNLIKENKCVTIWLDATFEHCWRNISRSKNPRPLASNRKLAEKLFEERLKFYSLAEWHFAVEPHLSSFEIAKRIVEQL